MGTITEKFIANTTWREAKAGPADLVINIEKGLSYLVIGTTLPTNETNAMLVRPVAGENYINVLLATGDKMYFKAIRDESILSWIAQDLTP